ncbi:hypothetical protein PYW49_04105 [Enterobacter sp. 170198]|uniref:Uncharacterized protein n=1 Tax=Enterobacter chinensis TaxID=3030997 RepID=A0ABU5D081_9ENTR|nr:hypothetical protein [Enterobacter sp. 170198]MDY0416861.1 hypothetical protein [Enterobacter sp. 170198]
MVNLLPAARRVTFYNKEKSPGHNRHHAFSVTFIPLEGVNVFKLNLSLLAVLVLSGCSSDLVLSPPKQPEYKSMPEITQSVTPSQQRAIMAGERPDWSERTPVNTIKRY